MKVQTHEQLFLKLKEGFYGGRLMEPDFYAKELGYPLKAPLRFLPEKVSDSDRTQTLVLNEGEFRDEWLEVKSLTSPLGERVVTTVFWQHSEKCLKEPDFREMWGANRLLLWMDTRPPHVRVPPGVVNVPGITWRAENEFGAQKMSARFEFNGRSLCLGRASFVMQKIKG